MKRYTNLIWLIWLVGILICLRLFWNTVVNANEWERVENLKMNATTSLPPKRGCIMDAERHPIAVNIDLYNLSVDLAAGSFREDSLFKYIDPLCDSLALFDSSKNAGQWKEYIEEHYDKFKTRKEKNKLYIAENKDKIDRYNSYLTRISELEKEISQLTDTTLKAEKNAELKRLKDLKAEIRRNQSNPYRNLLIKKYCDADELERLKKFPYFNSRKGTRCISKERIATRAKPFGSFAARTIGNVGLDDKDETHGISGLEKALDSLLFGKPGKAKKMHILKNKKYWEVEKTINGYDVVTTIDIRMQDILERQLYNICVEKEAEWATAVIMETATGDIKAISNLDRVKGTDEFREVYNHAFLGYELGSTSKPISMMIFLEDGFVGLNDQISVKAPYRYPSPAFGAIKDTHYPAKGYYTPKEVISQSSNIGITKLMERKYGAQPTKFRERLEEIGMFEPFNVGIAGESVPFIPRVKNNNQGRSDVARMSYGYRTRIPPIYILGFYNAIANNGKFVRPRLIKELWRDGECDTIFPVTYVREQVCSEKNAKILQDMLREVVLTGTGRSLKNNFVHISGKTGTANIIVDGRYKNGLGNNRVTFCGFFPSENPKYTCIVVTYRPMCGAPLSSGKVLMNTALEMYARGMLDSYSDYTKDEENKPNNKMKVHALNDKDRNTLKSGAGAKSAIVLQNTPSKEGVPNVIGLGLRNAIKELESAGLKVSAEGVGYVCSQSLQPGAAYNSGDTILLKLRNY